MKKLKVVTMFFLSVVTLALMYQNCGGQGPSNSLCFGSNCNQITGGSTGGGCPAATPYFIASLNSCQNCQYGYNSATQSCLQYKPPGSNPDYSCGIYVSGSQIADPSRNCAVGCTLNPGETMKCEAVSYILAPNDVLYGCAETQQNCTNQLNPNEWPKSTLTNGSFTYSKYNYTYLNNHQGPDDVQQNIILRDTQGKLSPVTKVLIKKAGSTGGSGFGPQTYSVTCNAGNNQSLTTDQTINLPAGVNAADLRITTVAVTSWTNNGFNAGQTYTNPPIFKAYFSSSILKLQCNQAALTGNFTIATGQGGNTTWEVTNRSQLP
ncbi:MAG: hypothetical protein IPM57_06505 [Oligoflexia bacterium]|nr:hypothetical protein [Oligoflexia bacterium]